MEQRKVGFSLKAVSNQMKRFLDKHAKSNSEITGMQQGIIEFIGNHPRERDVFQKDIETEFELRRSTATNILQRMERAELIRREPVSYDARLKKVCLTDRGHKIYEASQGESDQLESIITKGISPKDLKTFYNVLDRIADNIT